ncbi:VOC family protein [Rhizobium paknamense]|uniref:Catechol 2,3-dioxygenase-like lactoylglutathione lyase family enzyme n=1 Tax=Rhizobium paknamense TaxID=1206817 RepID=A0ABU0IJ82_9HYPH|nr:VOC family protein [Rhizobium paknamense]MDQ0458313.1 catechol 2,3-dioxygenase-like lactoylglutathione lyase family enzyme [Rhizobium paknamense]
MNMHKPIIVTNLQHHVFYVTDLERSRAFYTDLLDLQFSALNHPDSSAAMRLSQQEMRFFSFGFHHHDLCLVKHRKLQMDNGSMLHYCLAVRDPETFDAVRSRAQAMKLPIKEGRMLASAKPVARAFCVPDPDNHWIELIEELQP